MSPPVRIKLSRAKGWRMPENTVKVDRTSRWGNPFDFRRSEHCWTALAFDCRGDAAGRQEASVRAFRQWVGPHAEGTVALMEFQVKLGDAPISPKIEAGQAPTVDEIKAALRGKNLACWCALDAPCHANVLLELANSDEVRP